MLSRERPLKNPPIASGETGGFQWLAIYFLRQHEPRVDCLSRPLVALLSLKGPEALRPCLTAGLPFHEQSRKNFYSKNIMTILRLACLSFFIPECFVSI